MEDAAYRWHKEDCSGKPPSPPPKALLLTLLANRFLIYLDPDFEETEAQYEELVQGWGKEAVSQARGPYYHVRKTAEPRNEVRDPFKTPLQRPLKSGWGKLNCDQAAPLVSISRNASSNTTREDGDPFYEADDSLSFLPRGSEPKLYLSLFGYTPPPLSVHNRNNLPPRSPSPSDYGEPLI
jgi:hypothetical protein